MRILLILFSTIVISISAKAQRTLSQLEELTNNELSKLLANEDTVLLYRSGCVGCFYILEDSCTSIQTDYLIWNESDRCNVLKIDNCDPKKGTLKMKIWDTFRNELSQIIDSNLKSNITYSHYLYDELHIYVMDTVIVIDILEFHFDPDNRFLRRNKKQPAKVFLEQLVKSLNTI